MPRSKMIRSPSTATPPRPSPRSGASRSSTSSMPPGRSSRPSRDSSTRSTAAMSTKPATPSSAASSTGPCSAAPPRANSLPPRLKSSAPRLTTSRGCTCRTTGWSMAGMSTVAVARSTQKPSRASTRRSAGWRPSATPESGTSPQGSQCRNSPTTPPRVT